VKQYTRPVSTELDTRKLNAIVGSALRGLVESGASDEAIGAFAHDHRVKVSQLLGVGDAPAQQVDLESLVTSVVGKVLDEMGLAPGKSARKPAARIIVDVRGAKTSISINQALMNRLVAAKGGEKGAAKATLEELANAAPADARNRSKWVAERVEAILKMPQTAQGLVPAARH
jgi:hypothetical protein